jgi:S-adenosylmethionine-diacylglycerol 3-amino-3-carboxypropyl transferase
MKSIINRTRAIWFEIRIFISLFIVLLITSLSLLLFKNNPSVIEIAGRWIGLKDVQSIQYGYCIIAFFVSLASLIRMWAGSILTSKTVMAFKIQDGKMMLSGPFRVVRNPIYFADLIAFTSLSLCLKPIGLLIPVLIGIHYFQLIKYEEDTLINKYGKTFEEYLNSVPAIVPDFRHLSNLWHSLSEFNINIDGFRHNAQYTLFIPGLLVAAYTGKFIHALIIAFPAVIDWAIIHTIIGVSKESFSKKFLSVRDKKFKHSKVFRDILYAQCWEDPEIDRIAFKIKPGDTLFSITSGGCNALAFLVDDPEKVICVDMNRFQNMLLSVKISAFKKLTYEETLEFFGVLPSNRRWELFEKIKSQLAKDEQLYWQSKKADIDRGLIHCGKYERYMHLLKMALRILIGKKIIDDLFNSADSQERRILYETRWDNFRWRLFCKIFLSRTFAGIIFDKTFYKYVDTNFSFEKYYMSAIKKVITQLPVRENYFLSYILLGRYFNDNLPVYLKRENYELIRQRVDRIEIVTSGCMEYLSTLPASSISKFNFTNIFEWISSEEYMLLLMETIRTAENGAILTYRNHLVTRNRPESIADQIIPDTRLSSRLHKIDRSFIYRAYVVERINKTLCHS